MNKALIDDLIKQVELPDFTTKWLNSWAARAAQENWNDQQVYYLLDTALVHATVWGDLDTTGLSELHRRESYMGLEFNSHTQQEKPKAKLTTLEVIQNRRKKKAKTA